MSTDAAAYRDAHQRGGLADLSARTKVRLTGADRVRYLNGQVTANVTKLTADASLPACVTTAKGKLSADVFISASANALLVDAEPELREPLLARLERYIIADDVALADVTETFALLHYLPPVDAGIESLASSLPPPSQPIRANRFGRAGFDFFLPAELAADALQPLTREGGHVLLTETLLETLRLEAGLPRWGRELGEETLPPEAGLDRTHIDYHKGCYIGQEVISRLKSVGHVNRQLLVFTSPSGAPLAIGMQIFAPTDLTKPVGHLTSAAWSFALAQPIALGYLKRGASTDGLTARPADGDVIPIAIRELSAGVI